MKKLIKSNSSGIMMYDIMLNYFNLKKKINKKNSFSIKIIHKQILKEKIKMKFKKKKKIKKFILILIMKLVNLMNIIILIVNMLVKGILVNVKKIFLNKKD